MFSQNVFVYLFTKMRMYLQNGDILSMPFCKFFSTLSDHVFLHTFI